MRVDAKLAIITPSVAAGVALMAGLILANSNEPIWALCWPAACFVGFLIRASCVLVDVLLNQIRSDKAHKVEFEVGP